MSEMSVGGRGHPMALKRGPRSVNNDFRSEELHVRLVRDRCSRNGGVGEGKLLTKLGPTAAASVNSTIYTSGSRENAVQTGFTRIHHVSGVVPTQLTR